MHLYRLIAWSLAALVLLAGCGAERAGNEPSPAAGAATTAPASAPPSIAPAATGAPRPTTVQELPLIVFPDSPIALRPLVIELDDPPVYLTHAGDGSGRLFVVGKRGTISLLRDGVPAAAPFLDITDRVGSRGSEQGLLSVAFHPRYAENGRLFVNYTDTNGDTVISRFQAGGDSADPASEVVLLEIDQPYPNHNGGLVLFGPDGYLYIGMGDGGSGGDPEGHGQNLASLLGKMLRIDVDNGDPYAIPTDNPWANGSGGRPEIWAYGLRNPWRFSFDRTNGDLYIADVGQGNYEEVHLARAGSKGGENYGWNAMEGAHCFRGGNCDPGQFVAPIAEYDHSDGCSITGGYVYRGAQFPPLQGAYFFGDYCSGRVWTLRETGSGWTRTNALQTDLGLSSFGEDEAGELYITDLRGGVYQVIEAP